MDGEPATVESVKLEIVISYHLNYELGVNGDLTGLKEPIIPKWISSKWLVRMSSSSAPDAPPNKKSFRNVLKTKKIAVFFRIK